MIFKVLTEGLHFTWKELINHKFRAFLSFLGVSIGIMTIISVLSVVDSLEKNIRNSVDSLGENVIYIQKWPWQEEGGKDYEWWRYYKRPEVDLQEFNIIKESSNFSNLSAFVFDGTRTVKSKNNTIEDVNIRGITYRYLDLLNFDLVDGRFFNEEEINSGRAYVVVGNNVAKGLFENENPIGKRIKIAGMNTTVIGLIEKQGQSIVDFISLDDVILCSYLFGRRIINIDKSDPFIIIQPRDGISIRQLRDEVTAILRNQRTISPLEEDNFAINQVSIAKQFLDNLFGVINLAGWIIGGFSILVGGFGISNIMFVSVKERTSIIGIQKALGAKNYFILIQFLFEAIVLCLIGGALALAIVWILVILINNFIDFRLVLSTGNILLGIFISFFIGVFSGIMPAYSASRLDPVEAIRR